MSTSPFSDGRWSRCAKSRGQRSCHWMDRKSRCAMRLSQTSSRWMGRKSRPKSVTPGSSSRMAGLIVCRRTGYSGTREKSGPISGPSKSMPEPSREAVDRLRRDADIVVGVHIRQGDYRAWQGGKYFFPAARYAGWMRELAAQFPDRKVAFFVAATNREARTNFPDYRSDWAPVRRWATFTPWPVAIIFSDPKALSRNGLPFTATSRCFS